MAVVEISYLAFGSVIGALIIWAILSQRHRRIVESEISDAQTKLALAQSKIETLEKLKEEISTTMKDQFKVVAGEAFTTAVKTADQQKESVFKDATEALSSSMGEYMKAIQDAKEKDIERAATLGEKVDSVSELGATLAAETRELSLALRGDSQAQGAWGEVVVENLLQSMGFVEGNDYIKQFSETSEDKTRKRTDFILKLPDNRQVIIDSKVSLTAYTNYVNAEDEATSNKAIKDHCASIRKHAADLASKNYGHMKSIHTLDFVLMVVPLESAFIDAMRVEPNLYQDLLKNRRVKIVTGTSLMLTLMLIDELWQRENQSKNQIKLIEETGKLYDQITLFLESFTEVGFEIGQAQAAYNKARDRLTDGRGNVIKRTEDLKKLGVKTKKDLREKSGIKALAEEAEFHHYESNLELPSSSMVTVEAEEE